MSQRRADEDDDRVRAAFWAREADPASREGCPSAADVWAAVRGELAAEERRAIVSHTATCAACAEAWRLAMEVTPDPLPAAVPGSRFAFTALRSSRTFAPLAAAAAVAVALGAGVWLARAPQPIDAPFRGGDAPVIRSLSDDGEALPREDFRLRWSPGPEGSRYDVRVTTESLEVVADAQRLAEPSFLVPESALVKLPAGGRVLWRVEALLPGGERVASPTFVTILR